MSPAAACSPSTSGAFPLGHGFLNYCGYISFCNIKFFCFYVDLIKLKCVLSLQTHHSLKRATGDGAIWVTPESDGLKGRKPKLQL